MSKAKKNPKGKARKLFVDLLRDYQTFGMLPAELRGQISSQVLCDISKYNF